MGFQGSTGTVALLLAQHPDWTNGQIIQRMLTTTTPLASLAGKTVTGGLINAAAVVAPPPITPPADPEALLYLSDRWGLRSSVNRVLNALQRG